MKEYDICFVLLQKEGFMRKRISCFLMAFVMVASLALTNAGAVFADSEKELVILHINDTHARVKSVEDKEGNLTGVGYDRISQYKKDLMKTNPDVLLLDAGDTLHGQPIATISQGESIVDIMNLMGIDAMAPGNHDFNYGYNKLQDLEKKMNFPVIAANVVDKSGKEAFKPYIIKEMNGLKIGIFGLATPETAYKTNPKNVETLEFTDPVKAAEKAVAALKEEKVNLIIGLTHLGLDEGDYTSDKVAKGVSGIDVIIDGHSHSTLPEGRMVGDTLIASRGYYDKAFGIVTLKIASGKVTAKSAKLMDAKSAKELPQDQAVVDKIAAITESQKAILSQVIGKTSANLDGVREHVRAGETNFGQLVTDAMIDATKADLAITNGGGIRASIDMGDITKDNVLTAFPFGNYLVTKNIKGKDILVALEHGVSKYPEANGAFPHVAGITFTLDPSKAAGSRVSDAKIAGKDLDPEKEYLLVTNDFMAAGGDDYKMFKTAPIVNEFPGLDEVLIDYIKKSGTVKGEFASRINFLNKAETPVAEPVKPEVLPETKPEMKPESKPEVSAEVKPVVHESKYHIVMPGDVLWKIAQMHNTTWRVLADINKLKNPNLIYPNQKIMLPQ